MGDWPFAKGLQEIGDGDFAYLQPDGSWGWSNAGLITDGGESLLVDTLFDAKLTREMLESMRTERNSAEERAALLQDQYDRAQKLLEEERGRVIESNQFTVSETGIAELEQRMARILDNALKQGTSSESAKDELRKSYAGVDRNGYRCPGRIKCRYLP